MPHQAHLLQLILTVLFKTMSVSCDIRITCGSISIVSFFSLSLFGHLVLSLACLVTVRSVCAESLEALEQAVLIQRGKVLSPGWQVEQGHVTLFQVVTGVTGAKLQFS